MEVSEMSFQDIIRARALEKQREYLSLIHEQKRIAVRIERLKASMEHWNNVLEDEGVPTIPMREPPEGGFARPGNRSKDMPLRKAEWEEMSLTDAVQSILSQTDQTLHADTLVHLVYEIETQAEFKKAKHSLVSSLRSGAKNNLWKAEAKNHYRSIDDQQPAFAGV